MKNLKYEKNFISNIFFSPHPLTKTHILTKKTYFSRNTPKKYCLYSQKMYFCGIKKIIDHEY